MRIPDCQRCARPSHPAQPVPPISPDVDQIVGDTIVTGGSQTGCGSAQNENTIAVNPENPNNLVAGTNDYRVFNAARAAQRQFRLGVHHRSTAARRWKNIQLPHLTFQTGGTGAFSQFDSAGDPVARLRPAQHRVLRQHRLQPGSARRSGTEAANGIAVNVSHDGGLNWGEPVSIQVDGVDASGTLTPTRRSSTTRSGWPPTTAAVAST